MINRVRVHTSWRHHSSRLRSMCRRRRPAAHLRIGHWERRQPLLADVALPRIRRCRRRGNHRGEVVVLDSMGTAHSPLTDRYPLSRRPAFTRVSRCPRAMA